MILSSVPQTASTGFLGQTTWFLSDTSQVFCCGNNEYGQLGLGHTSHQNVPQLVQIPGNKKIISLSSGVRHTAFVTVDGKVYLFGHNDKNQFGMVTKQDKVANPMLLQHPNRFVAVACGNNHTLVLSESFEVFSFGSNDFGQLGVSRPSGMISRVELPEKVVSIMCGNDHSAALTENGTVYTWGCGTSGQLGLSHSQNVNYPEKLSSVTDRIIKVACGYMHTACLSDTGDLYVFGFMNNDLKFGQSGKKVKIFPPSDPVVSLASGSTHILALTASGTVFGMGVNGHGQLGVEGKIIPQVQEIISLKGKRVIQISCGWQHSVALTATDQVYGFGRNERGQLGIGHSKFQGTPALVNIPGVKRVVDIFHLSQQTPLSNTVSIDEETYVELPLPPTQYHEDYNLVFPQQIQEESTTLSFPQSFSIAGKKQ